MFKKVKNANSSQPDSFASRLLLGRELRAFPNRPINPPPQKVLPSVEEPPLPVPHVGCVWQLNTSKEIGNRLKRFPSW